MSLDLSKFLFILNTGGVLRANVVPEPFKIALLLSLASHLLLCLFKGLGFLCHLQVLIMLFGVVLTQNLLKVEVLEAVYILNKLVRNHLLVAQGVLTFLHGLLTLVAVGLVLLEGNGFVLSIHVIGASN